MATDLHTIYNNSNRREPLCEIFHPHMIHAFFGLANFLTKVFGKKDKEGVLLDRLPREERLASSPALAHFSDPR